MLPSSFKPDDTILLRDASFRHLDPELYQHLYPNHPNRMSVSKHNVMQADGDTYQLKAMEVADAKTGNVIVPPDHFSTVTIHDIQQAVAESTYEPKPLAPIGKKKRLTREIVTAIRNRAGEGIPHQQLAEAYDVSLQTVRDIIHFRTWRDVR